MDKDTNAIVITIDGPSGVGKGTLSRALARELGYHYLDSGAFYRLLAYSAISKAIPIDDVTELEKEALDLPVKFYSGEDGAKIELRGVDVTFEIRSEQVATVASQVASIAEIRQALLFLQRSFRKSPGLVADGRDMGTVVFPDADHKFYLTANTSVRAHRRYLELIGKGVDAEENKIRNDIEKRDLRDKQRTVAPMIPAEDAFQIDTSELNALQVLELVLKKLNE